jgi:hypothetical protein
MFINKYLLIHCLIVSALSAQSITISPNPIVVTDGSGLGIATIIWNAPGHSAVEIHLGSANGPLFAAGGAAGSAVTGKWVTDGGIVVDCGVN